MNIKLLLNEYFKYSWLFVLILFVSIVFTYASFQLVDSQVSSICLSFTLGLLAHFTVWNLMLGVCRLFKIKPSILFKLITFIWSIIILLIVSGAYIGIKNWGAPINLKLVLSAITEWRSFITLIANNTSIGIAACLVGWLLFFTYTQHTINKEIKANQIGIGLGSLTVIAAIIYLLNSTWFEKYIAKESEIFHAFFQPTKTLQRINNIDLGLSNLSQEIDIIEDFDKKNVLLFSIDCLRADHLSFNGYQRKTSPFLDSLYDAGSMKTVQLATSTCSSSFCGILSMLNSKNLQNLSYYKFGIHDYLKYQGYRINFILSGFHESWYDIKSHYGKNIDHYIEGKDKEAFTVNDDALIVDEVQSLPNFNGQPNFFFFHFMGPHNLGHKAEDYEHFKPIIDRGIIRKLRLANTENEELRKLYVNNYDNGVVQTDAYIKAILKSLKQKGYLDNALIVIAGDHGESLGEYNSFLGHGNALTPEFINIPILFIDDELDFYNEEVYATQIDIAPTIVDRLGLPIPDTWQGLSLKNRSKKRLTYHEQTPHGFEKSHVAIFNKQNEKLYKYSLDQNSDSEIFLQISPEIYTEDTLILSARMKDFYTENIRDYLGSNFQEIPNEVDSTYILGDGLHQTDSLRASIAIDRCDLIDPVEIKKYFGAGEDLLKTILFNKRRKACSTYFLWTGKGNVNRHITVNVDGSRSVKRNVNLVKTRLKFEQLKHPKIKYLFKSTESNSIALITQSRFLYVIDESVPGSIQSIDQAIQFAEFLYNAK